MSIPARPVSPESRALAYAETTLLVHAIYEEATSELRKLESGQAQVSELAAARRLLLERIADQEILVANDERGRNPEMSITAFEKHLKSVYNLDPELRAMRKENLDLQFQHDQAESHVRQVEFTLRVMTARMEELSGLLNFYAAAKEGRR